MIRLESVVETDDLTKIVSGYFDYPFEGKTSTEISTFTPPADFSLGVVVGPSGSGKSTIIQNLFQPCVPPVWDKNRAIVSHFTGLTEAIDRLGAVGLGSIPVWLRPFHTLSNGEQFRATLARQIGTGAVIDEFSSVVDRTVARSCSIALSKYIRRSRLRSVVVASCHYDIVKWLAPDWVYDTRSCSLFTGRWQSRPKLRVEIEPCSVKMWALFKQHHYLTAAINRSARCWVAVYNGEPIGFSSALAFPNGNFSGAWREHRTVVLPDYQGLGIGVRLSDAIAEIFKQNGHRYFSKTAHPRMGQYRNNSPLWTPTSKNMKARPDYLTNRATKEQKYKNLHIARVCYSHEYLGYAR